VAEVVTTLLTTPTAHINKVYELTGPRTQDMHALAAEYSDALRPALLADQIPSNGRVLIEPSRVAWAN